MEWIGNVEDKIELGIYSRPKSDSMIRDIHDVSKSTPDNMVTQVPQFHQCLKLVYLWRFQNLLVIVVCLASTILVIYGIVDASGSSFGSTLFCKGTFYYQIGTCSSKEDPNSSNWREFENLEYEVEILGVKDWLTRATVIFAKDN